MADAKSLAQAVYKALATAQPQQVIELISPAVEAASESPELLARLHSWHAQALLDLRQPQRAVDIARTGLSYAKQAGDDGGVVHLNQLCLQAHAQVNALRIKAGPSTPLSEAIAAMDNGDLARGQMLAEQVYESAENTGDYRRQVLSLLALARLPDRTQWAVQKARSVADASGDKNLIALIARTSKATGVKIPNHVF